MLTRRFALDSKGKKIYISDPVYYENKMYYVESISYLNWNNNQYLSLVDSKNKNKKIQFVLCNLVINSRKY